MCYCIMKVCPVNFRIFFTALSNVTKEMNHVLGENYVFRYMDFFFQNLLISLMSFVSLGIMISVFSHVLSVKKEKEQKVFCA